jgi:hypothetical protein
MRLDTKEKRLKARNAEIEYHKQKHDAQVQKVYGLIILRYQMGGLLCAKIYAGTSYHPIAHYSFKSEESREKTINNCIASAESHLAYKAERVRKRKEFVPTLKAGDVLYDSWGYDQTNVDFYQVLAVKGLTATIRPICSKPVKGSDGFMSCRVLPAINHFAEGSNPMKKRICQGDVIRTSDYGRYAHKWDGSELYCSWYA